MSSDLSLPSRYIELPYFCTKPPGTGSCDGSHNVESYQFRGNSKEFQDINPEDGWELLLKDFGTPNPVGQNTGGTGRNNPYFILYNKFNGKMKIYIAMMGSHTRQTSFLRIGFDNPDEGTEKSNTNQATRALFSNAESIQKTVLEFNPASEFKQMNQVVLMQNEQDYQWMVCELTTSYDPCACENPAAYSNKISTLRAQLVNVSTVNISATIDGKATAESVATNNNAKSTVDGSLASFFNPATEFGNSAQKGRKSWDDTKKTMDQIVDFGNDILVKQLAREWLRKDNPNFDDAALNSMNKAALKSVLSAPDNIKEMFGVRQAENTQVGKLLNATKGIASALPYVGMAIGIVDFLIDGGESSKSKEQSGPVSFDVNLKLTGELTEEQYVSQLSFYNPGSPIPSSSPGHLVPIYNNVLGVFNVLDLPDLEYYEINPNFTLDNILGGSGCIYLNEDFSNYEGAYNVKLRQYKPTSNIKYVINPASEMEVVSIDAAIIFEYSNNDSLRIRKPIAYQNTKAIPYHDLMSFSNSQIENVNIYGTELTSTENRVKSIENTSNLKLDFVSKNYPSDNSFIRFRTDYVPITCFSSNDFILLGSNNFGKVFVKLYIKLKHKTNPNAEYLTIVQSYDYTEKLKNAQKNSTLVGAYNTTLVYNLITQTYPGVLMCKHKYTDFQYGGFNRLFSPFENFLYNKYKWSIDFLPLNNQNDYSAPLDMTYTNQQFVTAKDRLTIPTGAVIPNNAILKAAGLIIIEPNVIFGNNIKIISGSRIDLKVPNSINPTLSLEIKPLSEILFNCTNLNFAAQHNTSQEIAQFCSNSTYTDRVYSRYRVDNRQEQEPIPTKPEYLNDFTIQPNPNTGNFTVIFNDLLAVDAKLIIQDLTGREVHQQLMPNDSSSFNVLTSGLSGGVYFVSVIQGEFKTTQKIMIQN